jgi:hypothetical protein
MKEESAVAAVYDRRTENETGAHRDAANVSSFYKNDLLFLIFLKYSESIRQS